MSTHRNNYLLFEMETGWNVLFQGISFWFPKSEGWTRPLLEGLRAPLRKALGGC